METEYFKVTTDYSGNAYNFKIVKNKTVIKYGRVFDGKFESGEIEGSFKQQEIENIVYFLKRGYSIDDMNKIRNSIKHSEKLKANPENVF